MGGVEWPATGWKPESKPFGSTEHGEAKLDCVTMCKCWRQRERPLTRLERTCVVGSYKVELHNIPNFCVLLFGMRFKKTVTI